MSSPASTLPPRCDPGRPGQLAWLGIGAGLALLASSVLFFFNPVENSFYPVCLFHRLTGLQCPGCGSLRALHHLLHAQFIAAFQCNPLLVALLPVAAWRAVAALARSQRGAPDAKPLPPAWIWTGTLVLLLFTVLRNLPYPQFSWMRP